MTFDEMISDLFDIVPRYGARPDVPIEAEEFFTELVGKFDSRDECRRQLEKTAKNLFQSLDSPPNWIQDPDWPWFEGKPMVFVGALDVPPGAFHDDASFYVFWSPETGVTECVIQVA